MLQTQVSLGLKFLREVSIRWHRIQCSPLRVFSACKNVTKVLKLSGGTFAGLKIKRWDFRRSYKSLKNAGLTKLAKLFYHVKERWMVLS